MGGYNTRVLKIKCAAIRYKDKVYEGVSHAKIGIKMIRDGICPGPYPSGNDQGFITECGKYVMRKAARMIALRAGQITEGNTLHPKLLVSQDLTDENNSEKDTT